MLVSMCSETDERRFDLTLPFSGPAHPGDRASAPFSSVRPLKGTATFPATRSRRNPPTEGRCLDRLPLPRTRPKQDPFSRLRV